jgi:hypothetical protein
MDLYSNNRMLNWEARRRVAELRNIATNHESAEGDAREERHAGEPFTGWHRTWHTLFHRANHGYEQA